MKFYLVLFFLCNIIFVSAKQITYNDAKALAMSFCGCSVTPYEKVLATSPSAEMPYYIFNRSGSSGFVIISGNDYLPSVLGYGDHGKFGGDNMPPQLIELLRYYENMYKETKKAKTIANPVPVNEQTKQPILLKTVNWDQGVPYNGLCPSPYTGCGATAMAIVMKYHNYPKRGKGRHEYVWNQQKLSMDFDFDFDWENTLDEYHNYTYDQGHHIAKIMYACGVALNMEYSENVSVSKTVAQEYLAKYFGYSQDCEAINRQNYTDDEWVSILDTELENKRLVLYRGDGNVDNSGHIFVVDGRDSSGLYHVNWGWGGDYNGYFSLARMAPVKNEDYSYNQMMVINIKPQDDGEFSPLVLSHSDGGCGLIYNKKKIVANDKFFAALSRLKNRSDELVNGEVALALTDKNGEIKEVLSKGTFSLRPNYGYKTYTYPSVVSSQNAKETDSLSVVYRLEGQSAWRSVLKRMHTKSTVSAYNNSPVYASLSWDIDDRIKMKSYNGQSSDNALKWSRYSFKLDIPNDVNYVTVKIDENEIEATDGWYRINFVDQDSYVISIDGFPKSAGVDAVDMASNDRIEIYNIQGVRIKNNVTTDDLENVKAHLAPGLYVIKQGLSVKKWIKNL